MRLIFPLIWNRYERKVRIRSTLLLIDKRGEEFDIWLERYNKFYSNLASGCKKRFLQRTVEFMRAKEFIYYELEKEEKIALLVSSAAIQISFGLESYMFDYFKKIHVLKTDYTYGAYKMPFMGHVNSNGIYFSWYNFMKGFEDYHDANNVGLHEMAHALAYINFIANSEQDGKFKRRFEAFSKVARPIFQEMQSGASTVLDKYAATDFQEFWAVTVETFFEKSKEMKTKMPELYDAVSILLNLDPLSDQTVIKEVA
jgi:MtfA peptidase